MYTVYTKPNCPQCDQAKALLESKGLEYKTVHLDVGQPKTADSEYIGRDDLLALIPGARMMPQIMKEGVAIGSLPELRKVLA
jgi:glutaredoxin 3